MFSGRWRILPAADDSVRKSENLVLQTPQLSAGEQGGKNLIRQAIDAGHRRNDCPAFRDPDAVLPDRTKLILIKSRPFGLWLFDSCP
jgi:hypothetical protein